MFGYNIPKLLIIEARRELKNDINSKHPSVRKLKRQANKIASNHARTAFALVLMWAMIFKIPSDIHSFKNYGFGDVFFNVFFDLLFFPFFFYIFTKAISLLVFYKKNGVPLKTMPPSPRSTKSFTPSGSSLSINPSSGLPMCGSVDISGNAPGHSRHD